MNIDEISDYKWQSHIDNKGYLKIKTLSKILLITSGGLRKALSATISFDAIELRALNAASRAGLASLSSVSASSLTIAISAAYRYANTNIYLYIYLCFHMDNNMLGR